MQHLHLLFRALRPPHLGDEHTLLSVFGTHTSRGGELASVQSQTPIVN